ncbi:hypothetical protein TWF696_000224 [Orbilia brochopaga]|uniref:F-box domain-containing protein n=1 Tax=Orbilia brochopaga TaxID=3140254 RepID=A0AAV9VDF8_9PEZI
MATTLDSLPVELHYEILSHLSHHEQIFASMANPFWRDILSQNQRFQSMRYSVPLGEGNGKVHSLIERVDSRILCTMRMGQQEKESDSKVEEFQFDYIFPQEGGQVVKYDISTCPFLDEPWFIPPTGMRVGRKEGDVRSEEKRGAKELQLRVGAVVCEPLWRGFFWVGDEFLYDPQMTVREMVGGRIADSLKEEIKSSPLLKALAQGVHPVRFRPVVRLLKQSGLGGHQQETFLDGQYAFDTRRSFARRQPLPRRRPADTSTLFGGW